MDVRRFPVPHIAHLARLDLSEEEIQRFEQQFASILSAFSALRELDLSGVEPLWTPVPHTLRLAKDQPDRPYDRNQMLEDAPDVFQFYLRLPSPLRSVRKKQ